MNSQFPVLRVPVYTVAQLANIPSLSTRRYIGLLAPEGSEAAGYAILILPIFPFFSWSCHSRLIRSYPEGVSVIQKLFVVVPSLAQMRDP